MSPWTEAKYISPAKLEEKVAEIRKSGKTITTLNDSFDLLHAGHLKMVHEASQQADVLIFSISFEVERPGISLTI